jgi:hypothetical protein
MQVFSGVFPCPAFVLRRQVISGILPTMIGAENFRSAFVVIVVRPNFCKSRLLIAVKQP